MDEPETINLNGYQIDLEGGRHVFVARYENCFYIRFRNAEGEETRLKLSTEAANALQYLLGEPKPTEDVIRKFLVHITQATTREAERLAWQAVTVDTVPQAPVNQ